jgi:hypothetical protein
MRCWLLSLLVLSLRPAFGADGDAFFTERVQPILAERCFDCHSHEKKIKGGLALDTRSGWEKGGDTGPALVPGTPNDSLLVKAVNYTDPDLQMPPKKKLTDAEIAVLTEWVKIGAPDPRGAAVATKRGVDFEEARKHWAFQPIRRPESATGIDSFISPAPRADDYTWLRRVSFDLTGLPPTPREIEDFTRDSSRERVIDRLLGSHAFGERWARHWLDLVGYADQIGTANNVPAPHAWRYRDYVIRAFNADKPFDEFVREQIAGDLLSATSPPERRDQLTATGFLVLGNINIVEADKDKLRVDVVDQQIEKVGKAFLGLTLQCARCHDHKFDPVTQRDYYGLAGIFTSTDSVYFTSRGVWSSIVFAELPQTEGERARLAAGTREHEQAVAQTKGELDEARQRSRELALHLDDEERETIEKQKADADKQARDLETRLRHLDYTRPSTPVAHGVWENGAPTDTHITIRGNPHAPGDTVPRGFVPVAFHGEPPIIPPGQSGRLQLAEWLTSPGNTLTARVLVNRVWQQLFGEGIVRSVDYVGLRGEQPSKPELLDYLASRLMSEGWSQKHLIREIALSSAYASASRSDGPQHRFRLDAEAIRDAVLAVSGDLVSCDGGPALALEYPENVSGLDPQNINPVAFSVSKFRPEQSRQRTIYLPVVRSSAQTGPSELLDVFDFAQPAQFMGQRAITTVPPQALYLMNGPLLKTQAARLADDLLKSSDAPARLAQLYLRVLNRPITAAETHEALDFLTAIHSEREAWTALCHALLSSNEFLFRL